MRKIRMGMVGGGPGAFIGNVHRIASRLDGHIDLVCGCFSSDPAKSKQAGAELYLPDDRVYGSFEEMIQTEATLPEDQRMDVVSIVTPNFMHFAPAKMAIEAGFHVVCDKPMTFTLDEAKELKQVVDNSDRIFALTHNYTGYPMVKQARQMIANGDLGEIRKIVVEYPQGWLATRLEESGQKQSSWRTDPKRAGKSCCMGDIGTHAENLAEYMTGLQISEMCAEFTTFVEGRPLEDDGNVLLRFDNGAKGILFASQISVGEENALNIRVYGTKGGIEWHQMEPNNLIVKWLDQPKQILRPGVDKPLLDAAAGACRLPAGHPEGFLEGFANIYHNVARCIQAKLDGKDPAPEHLDFPDVNDGLRGMAFIETVVASANSDQKWTPFTV